MGYGYGQCFGAKPASVFIWCLIGFSIIHYYWLQFTWRPTNGILLLAAGKCPCIDCVSSSASVRCESFSFPTHQIPIASLNGISDEPATFSFAFWVLIELPHRQIDTDDGIYGGYSGLIQGRRRVHCIYKIYQIRFADQFAKNQANQAYKCQQARPQKRLSGLLWGKEVVLLVDWVTKKIILIFYLDIF